MTPRETMQSVRAQHFALRKKGLKPTMIVVGEKTFVAFVKACDHIIMQNAMGIRQPPTMMGVPLRRTFEDQPFTVLTDGSEDR
jgi:hypothetical protein